MGVDGHGGWAIDWFDVVPVLDAQWDGWRVRRDGVVTTQLRESMHVVVVIACLLRVRPNIVT